MKYEAKKRYIIPTTQKTYHYNIWYMKGNITIIENPSGVFILTHYNWIVMGITSRHEYTLKMMN